MAEPKRAGLVPGFHAIKAAALAGRRARLQPVGIGPVDVRAGPSLDDATAAGQAMAAAWAAAVAGVAADLWVSPVGTHGARVIAGEAGR